MSHVPRSIGARTRAAATGALYVACLLMGSTRPLDAWGFEVHRFIAERAIEELPLELQPFFLKYRTQVVEHAIDPDLWRNAGFEDEPPRHFVDMDAYGDYPFEALPHDYEQALAKFGKEFVIKNGLLPWRTEEIYLKLVGAFKDQKSGRTYALDNIKFYTSIVAHYVSDAHVPFHAVVNYDGQLTGQHGLHARFETELFERYRSVLEIHPVKVVVTSSARDFVFDRLAESARLAGDVLAADREAIGSGDVYDKAYFDRFLARTRPTLERRISDAIGAVAAIVTKAWEESGKPDLPLTPLPREARKRLPPK